MLYTSYVRGSCLLIAITSLSLVIGAPAFAATAFPEPVLPSGHPYTPYTPPHPYPEPGSADFPEPGHYSRATLGYTQDELNDAIKYYRSDEFHQAMQQIRDEAEAIRKAQPTTPQQQQTQSALFPQVKTKAVAAIQRHIEKLEQLKQFNLGKPGLNDNIGTSLQDRTKAIDDKIKSDLTAFLDAQKAYLTGILSRTQATTTVEQLQALIDEVQDYTHKQENTEAAKSLAARVVSQSLLSFSSYIQALVDFADCVIPRLGASGFDITKHKKYITDANSPLKIDWYSKTLIPPDMYHRWTDGKSYGAMQEYQLASEILANPVCKGNQACKDATIVHTRRAKYMLQDMFHIAYWGYDNLMVQMENGLKPQGATDLTMKCQLPASPMNYTSGDVAPSGFSRATWATPKPMNSPGTGRTRLGQ
jgi:predicted DNA-binding protein